MNVDRFVSGSRTPPQARLATPHVDADELELSVAHFAACTAWVGTEVSPALNARADLPRRKPGWLHRAGCRGDDTCI